MSARPTPQRYDAVILAGHSDRPTPLEIATSQPRKALLPIQGRPMVHYVADALRASERIRRLVVVGLARADVPALDAGCPTIYLPNGKGILDNALRALDALGSEEPVLFCGSDLPLLSAAAVCDLVERAEASGAEVCYPIVSREVMEARFPHSGRSFRPLVEGDFAGGDLFWITPRALRRNLALLQRLTSSRKSALRAAAALGPEIILRYLLRRLHLRDAERRGSQLLGCSCKAIVSPYAELAMDVDKPKHLQVVLRAMGEEA